jgi:hypothetical protein
MKLIEYIQEEKCNHKYNISKRYIMFYNNDKKIFNLKLSTSRQIRDKLGLLNLFISNNFNYNNIQFILNFQNDFNIVFKDHFKNNISFLNNILIKNLDNNDKLPSNIININNTYIKANKNMFLKKYKFNEFGLISYDYILTDNIILKLKDKYMYGKFDFEFVDSEYLDYAKTTYKNILFNINHIQYF